MSFKWIEYSAVNGYATGFIDDDFTVDLSGNWVNLYEEIIKEYSLRKLPVVPNLLLAMKVSFAYET